MTIKATIWDLGGVILRTTNPEPRNELAEKFGKSSRELEYIFYSGSSGDKCQLGEISYEEHVENVRLLLNLSPEEMEQFIEQFWGGDIFDYDLVNYIREIKQNYKTSLLSNAFPNLREWLSQGNKVDGVFDEMLISAEVGLVKPDPAIYNLALEKLDVKPEEAVFIDDMPQNVESARDIGMQAVRFTSPEQVKDALTDMLSI